MSSGNSGFIGTGKSGGGDPNGGNGEGEIGAGGNSPNSNPDCQGIGGGHSLVPVEDQDPSDPSNPYPPPTNPTGPTTPTNPSCEEDEGSFTGEIDATDLKYHRKANCIYNKLSQTKTMEDVISKFAGKNTDFDLDIEVGNVEDGYGTLLSSRNSNTFTMRIDEEGLLQRKSIETAVTFMHEAIHAEMRRYLHGATDTSTLPGFPGDFTHDWELFVREFYGSNVDPAEHEAMAVKYRDIIVEGLIEYDNNALTTDEYRALAWHGLPIQSTIEMF